MALMPGRYSLKVGATGYSSATVPGVEVSAGGSGNRVRVTLARGGTIRGRTVDDQGQPLAGVRVATTPNLLFAFGRAAPVPAGASTLSDAQGSFTLSGVATGDRVYLFAAKEGFEQRGAVQVTSSADSETASVEVRLAASSRGEEAERDFAGVGLTLSSRGDAVQVVEVFEGGPAREVGLRPGDQIVGVDGVAVQGQQLSDVISRIRGVVGTTVSLEVRRDDRDFVLAIPRAAVKF
jgi:membrane-associated protease RseP (regulator of RpoE activity)